MSNLPHGWEEATIADVTTAFLSIDPTKAPDQTFRYVDIGSIDNKSQTITAPKAFAGRDAPSRARRVIQTGDTLFSTVRTYLKNIALVPGGLNGELTSTGIAVLRPSCAVDANYLFRWVSSDPFVDDLSATQDGTMYPAVSDNDVGNATIPLPPLPEQRRIVKKIDILTDKSRRARDHLDHIPRLVEKYKQAILAAAFRGDLTREFSNAGKSNRTEVDAWKQALCVRLNSRSWKSSNEAPDVYEGAPARWLRCYIGDVVVHRSGVAFKSGDFSKTGTQVIRLGNLYNGVLDLSRNPVFLKNADQYGAFFGETGDVLVAQTGTRFKRDYGHFVVLNESHRGILVNQRIACLTPTKALNPYFLKLFSHLDTFKDHFFRHETGGVNQGNVGLAGIMDAPIALPSRIEQDAIVNRLHAAFNWIDRLAADTNSARKLIDNLDQAVLAKAFKGELVPQDPADEPANILLERMRTERAAAPNAKRGRKKKA